LASRQGVWTGRVESGVLRLPVLNPKLKPPQDYLWNACPQQALKLLKADHSWISNRDREDQCTPLHHAARFGYKDVVIWLIPSTMNSKLPCMQALIRPRFHETNCRLPFIF
jgi:hypothetical protein